MKTLRITGVPEHFNFPWKKVVDMQPFDSQGIFLNWQDESRGSGQMNMALRKDETDIAIVLTESFLKDREEGNPSKMIGFHVKSPLIWGIHIHGKCAVDSPGQLDSPAFLISRKGSGSHLMGYVLAQREGWDPKALDFKVVNNLSGALASMTPDSPEMFLWEKYTTKPWVDSGELKRIGEVPSPWPCFTIVASEKALKEYGSVIFSLRDRVYHESRACSNLPGISKILASNYSLKEQDVIAWLSQTTWATEPTISAKELDEAMDRMIALGILTRRLPLNDFLTVDNIQMVL